jgi:hypothetical protein
MAKARDFLTEIVRETMQQLLDAEMTDAIGVKPAERSESCLAAWLRTLPQGTVWATCPARQVTTDCRSSGGSAAAAMGPRPRKTFRPGSARWQKTYPRLCDWVEENIAETLTFYRLPREHHKHMKSTNMLKGGGLKRRHHGRTDLMP